MCYYHGTLASTNHTCIITTKRINIAYSTHVITTVTLFTIIPAIFSVTTLTIVATVTVVTSVI